MATATFNNSWDYNAIAEAAGAKSLAACSWDGTKSPGRLEVPDVTQAALAAAVAAYDDRAARKARKKEADRAKNSDDIAKKKRTGFTLPSGKKIPLDEFFEAKYERAVRLATARESVGGSLDTVIPLVTSDGRRHRLSLREIKDNAAAYRAAVDALILEEATADAAIEAE